MAIVDYNFGLISENNSVQASTAAERIEDNLKALADVARPRSWYVVEASDTPRHGDAADYQCDGTADQVQIQSAIDAANAAGGGTVLLREGTFTISDSIVIKSGVELIGEGMTRTIIDANGSYATQGAAWSAIDHDRNNVGIGSEIEDVRIADLTIDCAGLRSSGSYFTNGKAIYATYCLRWLIERVRCVSSSATAIGIDFLVDCVIRDCVIDGYGQQLTNPDTQFGGNGIGIGTGEYDIESFHIYGNTINEGSSAGNNGILIERQPASGTPGKAEGWNVYGNTINGGSRGIRIAGAQGGTVSNNTIIEADEDAIIITGYPTFVTGDAQDEVIKDIAIVGNVATNCGGGGVLVHINASTDNNMDTSDILIANNVLTFNGTSGPGIRINRSSTAGDVLERVTITGNHIYNCQSIGIAVVGSSNGQAQNVTVTGNHVTLVGSDGIVVDGGSDITITGNRIDTCDKNGIRISSGTTDCERLAIYGNDIRNPGDSESGTVDENGIRLGVNGSPNVSQDIYVGQNNILDDRGTTKMEFGIYVESTTDAITIDGLNVAGEKASDPWVGIEDATKLVRVTNCNTLNNGSRGVAAVSPGASPWTRTAGPVRETLYLNGGTVTNVTKGGDTLGAVTIINLEPNESCVVTYSSAPTVYADRR
jgi:parallel beta-helix repeat protein